MSALLDDLSSPSQRVPQIEPSNHCYTILQDHGQNDGGWGPAAVILPWQDKPAPFVYTGSAPHVLEFLMELVRKLAVDTGKPTRLVRYTERQDVCVEEP